MSDEAARRAGRAAADVAAASARVARQAGALIDLPPVTGSWASECVVDPFTVGLAEKGDMLVQATSTSSRARRRLAEGLYQIWDTAKWLVSSDGHRIDQRIRECGAGIMATAIGDGETQRRSYPAARGQYGTRGWELVREIDLEANAARVGEESKALLSAPPCPSGETTLILGDEQMALQIHESVGHAIELDRILGWEAAYAGTSWLDLTQLGDLQYGSELMNITIDPTIPGALGSFGFDDEGTPAASHDAVREGRWVGVLSGRDSAAVAGLDYAGSVRADGWARLPMVRMTNVGLEPGPHTLEEMIAATDDGIFMDTNRSWSIDDKRLNFQFGCEIAYEVKDGRLGTDAAQPHVHGDRAAVLALDGHAVVGDRAVGDAQLRQGPTGPGRPHRPSRRPGSLSATSEWGCGDEHRRAPLRSGGSELGRRATASRGHGRCGDERSAIDRRQAARAGGRHRRRSRDRGVRRLQPPGADPVRQLGDPPERR